MIADEINDRVLRAAAGFEERDRTGGIPHVARGRSVVEIRAVVVPGRAEMHGDERSGWQRELRGEDKIPYAVRVQLPLSQGRRRPVRIVELNCFKPGIGTRRVEQHLVDDNGRLDGAWQNTGAQKKDVKRPIHPHRYLHHTIVRNNSLPTIRPRDASRPEGYAILCAENPSRYTGYYETEPHCALARRSNCCKRALRARRGGYHAGDSGAPGRHCRAPETTHGAQGSEPDANRSPSDRRGA